MTDPDPAKSAGSGTLIPRPPKPPRAIANPAPKVSDFPYLPQLVKRLALGVVDRGWFGLTPLETHVVICGFPRAGSTLLLLMAETCVANARRFGQEARALWKARVAWRNQPLMITKRPMDIFWTDEIRAYYAPRNVRVRFVATVRDPRAVLTSFHARTGQDRHHVSVWQWRQYYEHYRYNRQFNDVLSVRYEDLVSAPRDEEKRLTDFIGWNVVLPFDQFHTVPPPKGFRVTALNGIRPVDASSAERWREPRHGDRIRALLGEIPDLPEILIDMGYEVDTSWAREYI